MIKSKKQFCSILGIKQETLNHLVNELEKYYQPYTKKTIKEDGTIKERLISPSIGILKSIQKKINKRIFKNFKFPSYVQGSVKGRDNISNALLHKGNKYKLCTDLKGFYPSVNHHHVYQTMIELKFSPKVASLITKLVTLNGETPQGTPSSPIITNLVFLPYDKKLDDFCVKHNITYTRYVDDLMFSSQQDFKEISLDILAIVNDSPFLTHHGKTFYTAGKAESVGVEIGQNNIRPTKEFKQKLVTEVEMPLVNKKRMKGLMGYQERIKKVNGYSKSKVFKIQEVKSK